MRYINVGALLLFSHSIRSWVDRKGIKRQIHPTLRAGDNRVGGIRVFLPGGMKSGTGIL